MNPAMQQSHQTRKRNFLNGLGNVMLQRGMPLPPQLTGVQPPQTYDISASPWRSLDVSTADIGVVRLAGKDVDLFKLWALVQQAGGSAKVRLGLKQHYCAHNMMAIGADQRTGHVAPPASASRPPRAIHTAKRSASGHSSSYVREASPGQRLYRRPATSNSPRLVSTGSRQRLH